MACKIMHLHECLLTFRLGFFFQIGRFWQRGRFVGVPYSKCGLQVGDVLRFSEATQAYEAVPYRLEEVLCNTTCNMQQIYPYIPVHMRAYPRISVGMPTSPIPQSRFPVTVHKFVSCSPWNRWDSLKKLFERECERTCVFECERKCEVECERQCEVECEWGC